MQIFVNGIITGLTISVLAMAFSVVYLSTAGLDVQPIRKFCGVIVDNTIFRQLQENKSGTKSIKSAIMSAVLVL